MKLLKEYSVKEWAICIGLIALLTIDWAALLLGV